jgi:CheY-like chemotaxis protein
MPEEDGYALITKIRARSPEHGGDIPAAALTAYAKIEDRVKILAAGFQMYLSKPADPSELIAVVASLAVRRRTCIAASPEVSSGPE